MRPAAAETSPMHDPFELASVDRITFCICISRLELAAWWPKIQDGGWLCGANYCRPSERPAVDRFFQQARVQVHYWGHSQFCAGKRVDASPRGSKASFTQDRGGGTSEGAGWVCEDTVRRGGTHRRSNTSATRPSTTGADRV